MKVLFHPEALRELREVFEWYTKRGASGAAARLVRLVDARIEEIARTPESFPKDPERSWARRARILGWPYALVFTIHDEREVVVLAVAHGRRRPGFWAKRRRR
jgi:plasmid stabilization system protein ParE